MKLGADLHVVSNVGWPALMYAVENSKVVLESTVKTLLSHLVTGEFNSPADSLDIYGSHTMSVSSPTPR